jgi:hypothetical protein
MCLICEGKEIGYSNLIGLKKLDCYGCNCPSLIFGPEEAIKQVRIEIVKKNLQNYFSKQTKEFILKN